jgi:hypothetical protein
MQTFYFPLCFLFLLYFNCSNANLSSSVSCIFINLAGTPPTIVYGGTSLFTTEPAATTAFAPTVTPFRIVEFAPIHTPFFYPNWCSIIRLFFDFGTVMIMVIYADIWADCYATINGD